MTRYRHDPAITPDGEPPDPGLPADGGAGGGALPDPRRIPPALRGGLLTPREEQRLQQKELQRALDRPDVQTTADARRAVEEQRRRRRGEDRRNRDAFAIGPTVGSETGGPIGGTPAPEFVGPPLVDGPDGPVGRDPFALDLGISPPAGVGGESVGGGDGRLVELPDVGFGGLDDREPLF